VLDPVLEVGDHTVELLRPQRQHARDDGHRAPQPFLQAPGEVAELAYREPPQQDGRREEGGYQQDHRGQRAQPPRYPQPAKPPHDGLKQRGDQYGGDDRDRQ
jgi:hypothetical protein